MKGIQGTLMKKIIKLIALVLITTSLLFSTGVIHAGAPMYILYRDLHTVWCRKGTSPTDPSIGPYYAYMDVTIPTEYPAGSWKREVITVNGTVTRDLFTFLPAAASGIFAAERIDTTTPNYTATKRVELWYGGILRSKTEIKVWCNDSLTGGPGGLYGYIISAEIF
jgi:hypothetical protein